MCNIEIQAHLAETSEFNSVVDENLMDGVILLVSLIWRECLHACASRVFNEHGDRIKQFGVKYGLIIDEQD